MKAGIEPRSAALEANALTTRPTRWSGFVAPYTHSRDMGLEDRPASREHITSGLKPGKAEALAAKRRHA